MLGQEADLQVQIGSTVRLCRHSVLGDQDESGEENRFDGGEHRQNHERRVEFESRRPPEIEQDPKAEQKQVQTNETHAPGERRNGIGDPVLSASPLLFAPAPFQKRVDIPFDDSSRGRGILLLPGAAHA
jgi:hypothetical protein